MQNGSECLSEPSLASQSNQYKLLQEAHRKKVIEYIPLIVVFFITPVIGIIGNILTILFYGFKMRRTPTFYLIKLLAIVDLIVCFLCFTTIADLCVNIKFTSAILCKLMYYLDHSLVMVSMTILWIISIHRYRKICRPFGRQFTVKSATVVVILASGFSMLYCANVFITYNPVKINISTSDPSIPSVVGHYCTSTDDNNLKDVLLTFHVIDALVVTVAFVTFVFAYGNIWLTVRKQKRAATQVQTVQFYARRQNALHTFHETIQISSASSKENASMEQFTFPFDRTTDSFSEHHTDSDQTSSTLERANAARSTRTIQKSSKSSTAIARKRNITLMMFVATVGLVICFTPYFVSVGLRAMSATTEDELLESERVTVILQI